MWEYQVFDYDIGDLETVLNTEGDDGWELSFIIPSYFTSSDTISASGRVWSETGTVILKRLVLPTPITLDEWDLTEFELELERAEDLKDMVLE